MRLAKITKGMSIDREEVQGLILEPLQCLGWGVRWSQ